MTSLPYRFFVQPIFLTFTLTFLLSYCSKTTSYLTSSSYSSSSIRSYPRKTFSLYQALADNEEILDMQYENNNNPRNSKKMISREEKARSWFQQIVQKNKADLPLFKEVSETGLYSIENMILPTKPD